METRRTVCHLCCAHDTSVSLRLPQAHQSSILLSISPLPPPPPPSLLLLRTDNRLFTGWFLRSIRAEVNLLGVSQAPRERHDGPVAFAPSGGRSAQVPEAFSASAHQTMRTRIAGRVTTKFLYTRQHAASQQRPSQTHGIRILWRRGTWYAADRARYTQRNPQNTRDEKPYGTTR